jgi:hypothetical protein
MLCSLCSWVRLYIIRSMFVNTMLPWWISGQGGLAGESVCCLLVRSASRSFWTVSMLSPFPRGCSPGLGEVSFIFTKLLMSRRNLQ